MLQTNPRAINGSKIGLKKLGDRPLSRRGA
jgi:hypothetical protein